MADTNKNLGIKLESLSKLIDFLSDKRYTLSDIGLKSKQAFDWTKAGLFLEEKESKYRRTYNPIEYVWLRIIQELRDFGLSIHAIRELKNFLLRTVNVEELLTSFIDIENHNNELKTFQKAFKHKFLTQSEKTESASQSNVIETLLALIVIQTIFNKTNIHLLITKEGKTLVTDGEPFDEHVNLGDILNAPYLAFPLRNIVADFVKREDLISLGEENEVFVISKDEEKVLNLLRKGNLVSLAVRFGKDKEIKLIETEEKIDLENIRGKLTDLVMRNQYQTITYKTQDGKITNMRRKTLHK